MNLKTYTIKIKETGKGHKTREFRVTGATPLDAEKMAIELFSNQLKAQGQGRKETYCVSINRGDKWRRYTGFMGHHGSLSLEAL